MSTHRAQFRILAAAALAAACGRTDKQPATDTAAVTGPQRIAEAPGMKTPESVRYDPAQDLWFVSNINGNPSQKDGNGFIVRLTAEAPTREEAQSLLNEVIERLSPGS